MPSSDEPSYASLLGDPPLLSVLGMMAAGIVGLQAVPPALPSVGSALVVSDERVGLVISAFFAAAAVTLPLAGGVADLYGRRRVALVSLGLYALPGLATPFVGSFQELLVLRAFQGAAFPGIVPLSITITGDLYAGTAGSMAQGLRISVNGIAATVTPVFAGVLAGFAWFFPFLLYAVSVPVLAFALVFLPETGDVEGARSRSRAGAPVGGVVDYARAVAVELRQRRLLVLVVGAFVTFFCQYAVVAFLPLFAVRELGESAATGGLLLSVVGGCRVVVPLFSEPLVARFSRKRVLLATLAGTAAATALLAVAPTPLAVGAVVVGFGTSLALFLPVLNDTVTLLATAERRASVVNTMELGKIVAIGSSPAVFGIVLGDAGFAVVFALAGVLLGGYVLLAGVLLLDADLDNRDDHDDYDDPHAADG